MKMNEIIEGIKMLATGQGFYGRLLENINDLDDESYQDVKNEWESQNFENIVDFVLYIEG